MQLGCELLALFSERLKLTKLNPTRSITQRHNCLFVSEAAVRVKDAENQRVVRNEIASNQQLFCPSKLHR